MDIATDKMNCFIQLTKPQLTEDTADDHWCRVKPVWHRTRLGTRFQYGILGYTRVDWYEYSTPTVPEDELVRFRLECSTSMYEHSTDILDQGLNMIYKTIFIRLLHGPKYGLLRPSTIKHDFYSINWTFTGFTYGPIDFYSSSIPYDFYTILTRLSSLVEWTSCAVVYTVSHGLTRSLTVLYNR